MELNALTISPVQVGSGSRVPSVQGDGTPFKLPAKDLQPGTQNSELGTQNSELKTDEAREAAGQLVASAFIMPFLASVRENSFGEGPFAPNIVERRFGPVMDQHVADQIMQGTNFDLVDTIVDRYQQMRAENLGGGPDGLAQHSQREWTA